MTSKYDQLREMREAAAQPRPRVTKIPGVTKISVTKRGRPPLGGKAMTGAERIRRMRARPK